MGIFTPDLGHRPDDALNQVRNVRREGPGDRSDRYSHAPTKKRSPRSDQVPSSGGAT